MSVRHLVCYAKTVAPRKYNAPTTAANQPAGPAVHRLWSDPAKVTESRGSRKGVSILVEKLYAKGKNNGQKLHIAMHITRWKTTDKAKPNFEYLKIKFVHNI